MVSPHVALQAKNKTRSVSMEIWMTVPIINVTVSMYRKAMPYTTMNWHFVLSAKRNGTQRRTTLSIRCMHFLYCGICQKIPVRLKHEKVKPVDIIPVIKFACLKALVSKSV